MAKTGEENQSVELAHALEGKLELKPDSSLLQDITQAFLLCFVTNSKAFS